MAPTKQRPMHEIRCKSIRAAIWANETENREVWFNVTLSRFYKVNDKWQDTTAFRRDDLPNVAEVVEMASAWIRGQDVPDSSDQAVE